MCQRSVKTDGGIYSRLLIITAKFLLLKLPAHAVSLALAILFTLVILLTLARQLHM